MEEDLSKLSDIELIQRYNKAKRYSSYMGKKRKKLVEQFGYDTKNAAHLLRLLRMGTEFLNTGRLQVYRTDDANELKEIKGGKWTLEKVKKTADKAFLDMELAYKSTKLPDEPNRKEANELLLDTIEHTLEL